MTDKARLKELKKQLKDLTGAWKNLKNTGSPKEVLLSLKGAMQEIAKRIKVLEVEIEENEKNNPEGSRKNPIAIVATSKNHWKWSMDDVDLIWDDKDIVKFNLLMEFVKLEAGHWVIDEVTPSSKTSTGLQVAVEKLKVKYYEKGGELEMKLYLQFKVIMGSQVNTDTAGMGFSLESKQKSAIAEMTKGFTLSLGTSKSVNAPGATGTIRRVWLFKNVNGKLKSKIIDRMDDVENLDGDGTSAGGMLDGDIDPKVHNNDHKYQNEFKKLFGKNPEIELVDEDGDN